MARARRTTNRSRSGKKLYAVRDAGGRFRDIQNYERAHRQDLARTAAVERPARKKAKQTTRGKRAQKATG